MKNLKAKLGAAVRIRNIVGWTALGYLPCWLAWLYGIHFLDWPSILPGFPGAILVALWIAFVFATMNASSYRRQLANQHDVNDA